jgi:alkylation response protein AidB-like acyl-CoA dehydrogenase
MSQDLTDIHDELRAVARNLLKNASPEWQRVGDEARDLDWRLLVDSGWLGLEIPEAHGGGEATFAEAAVVLEEMGRAVSTSDYLGTAVLGAGALLALEPSPVRDGLLRAVAAGDVRLAVAVLDGEGDAARAEPPFRLEAVPGGWRLYGRAVFVPDAPGADHFVLLARDVRGETVVVVPSSGLAQLSVTRQPVLDPTRHFGTVASEGAMLAPDSVWRFTGDPVREARALFDRGALAIACDSLGIAGAMLDATVAYAGVRRQFGRPIGSFQAVKHACADMLVSISVGRELVREAVRAFTAGDPAASIAVSHAKSYVGAAAVEVVGKAMQLHGGIGYTWETGIHAYLKRAALNRSLFGSPRAHRRRIAARYLETAVPNRAAR